MSYITDIMLTFRPDDDNLNAITKINSALVINGYGALNKVNQLAGGIKVFVPRLYIGSFNHLDLDWFKELIESQQWEGRDTVQLFIQSEIEFTFTVYNLSE